MRALFLSVACLITIGACGGDAADSQPPERLRACGELEGVTPVEPVVVGEHPLSHGLEGTCPIIAPIPCTSPKDDYVSLCGPHCWPATATHESGDEWLIGCEYSLMTPCIDLEPDVELGPLCLMDPYAGDQFWFRLSGCPVGFDALFCFDPCERISNWPDAPEFCPQR